MTGDLSRHSDPWRLPAARSFLLFVNFFLIILAYYLVKPASRSLFLEHADAAQLPYVWTASALLLLSLMPLYQYILRRFTRLRVVIGTCLLIAILLVAFRFWMYTSPGIVVAVSFYILVDVFSVVLVEQFWSLTDSVYRREEGNRWYGLIGSGGLLGGVFGGVLAGTLVERTPVTTIDLLLIAALIILLMGGLTLWLSRHGLYQEAPAQVRPESVRIALHKGWRTLRASPYLLLIALILLLSQVAEPIVEYQFMTLVEQSFPERESRTAYLSHFLSLLSGAALLINLLVTPLVHRSLGAIAGLLVQPVMLGAAAVIFTVQANLSWAALLKMTDRGLSYSINRASRELLYIPVRPETTYRAKAWIDMVGYRSFKIIGNLVILLLTQWLPWQLGIVDLSWAVLVIAALWVTAVWRLRRHYRAVSAAAKERELIASPDPATPG